MNKIEDIKLTNKDLPRIVHLIFDETQDQNVVGKQVVQKIIKNSGGGELSDYCYSTAVFRSGLGVSVSIQHKDDSSKFCVREVKENEPNS